MGRVFNKIFKNLKDYNIYADLAGRGKEFFELQNKLGGKAFSVGDVCDRGLETKDLFDYFMKNNSLVLMGNHDHMMYDFFTSQKYYGISAWLMNSAGNTLRSFIPADKLPEFNRLEFEFKDLFAALQNGHYEVSEKPGLENRKNKVSQIIFEFVKPYVDKSYIEFLASLPFFYQDEEVLITHAPLDPQVSLIGVVPGNLWTAQPEAARSVLWNKISFGKRDQIQIFGHLGLEKPKIYLDAEGKPYGLCLDGSKGNKLWCYSVNQDKMFSQDYL